jgi:hypothetical protein
MTKKQIIKAQTGFIKIERIVLWLIIIILIVLQGVSAWYLIKLWDDESRYSKYHLATIINESEEKRYKDPVVNISENKVYIPEARIYLPLNEATRDLRYDYFATQNYKSLRLSTSSIVGSQIEKDDHACDKVVVLSVTKEPTSTAYSYVGEIQPTKDGLRYISVHNKDTCSYYQGNVQEDLTKAAKEAQAY